LSTNPRKKRPGFFSENLYAASSLMFDSAGGAGFCRRLQSESGNLAKFVLRLADERTSLVEDGAYSGLKSWRTLAFSGFAIVS
jgi:hypothetical protein